MTELTPEQQALADKIQAELQQWVERQPVIGQPLTFEHYQQAGAAWFGCEPDDIESVACDARLADDGAVRIVFKIRPKIERVEFTVRVGDDG